MIYQNTSQTTDHSGILAKRVTAALIGALVGSFLIYGVGFAQPSSLHNAAHDGRHAFTFPCH